MLNELSCIIKDVATKKHNAGIEAEQVKKDMCWHICNAMLNKPPVRHCDVIINSVSGMKIEEKDKNANKIIRTSSIL